jgi:hypothetical protein
MYFHTATTLATARQLEQLRGRVSKGRPCSLLISRALEAVAAAAQHEVRKTRLQVNRQTSLLCSNRSAHTQHISSAPSNVLTGAGGGRASRLRSCPMCRATRRRVSRRTGMPHVGSVVWRSDRRTSTSSLLCFFTTVAGARRRCCREQGITVRASPDASWKSW